MLDEFVQIIPTREDLPDMLECWKECTCAQRMQEISEHSIKARGSAPAFNMLYIKEVVFTITRNVEIRHLLLLRQRIKSRFGLDCFQACIDRKNSQVHMLFDWYDRETQQSIYLYKTRRYAFCSVIIQTLDLPYPSTSDRCLRYFLVEEYLQDPEIFDRMLDWVRHQQPSARSYQVFFNVLHYAKSRCQGIVK